MREKERENKEQRGITRENIEIRTLPRELEIGIRTFTRQREIEKMENKEY